MSDSGANPLRVVSFTTVFPRPDDGSMGLFVRNRLEAIARTGDSVEIIVVSPIPFIEYSGFLSQRRLRQPDAVEERDGAVLVHRPRWIYPPFAGAGNALFLFFFSLRTLFALRRSFRFSLIDAHFGFPDGVAAWLLATVCGRPYTITLRGNEVVHVRHRWRRLLLRHALRRAGLVIAVSERLRGFAVSLGVDPERAVTVPNGVDASLFRPRDRRDCRAKHGISEASPVVVSVGHLIEEKGHHRAIEAIRAIRQSGVPARLLIVGGQGGGGNYESQLRQLAGEFGDAEAIAFLGQVCQETLAELLCAADVMCLASSREGWPNVVHESLACGTPVVATDVGAVPEMIPAGDYGYIVPPDSPTALADALALALDRQWDRAAISSHGQQRSWDHVARDVISHWRRVLAAP